jgi:hypothetical protein
MIILSYKIKNKIQKIYNKKTGMHTRVYSPKPHDVVEALGVGEVVVNVLP